LPLGEKGETLREKAFAKKKQTAFLKGCRSHQGKRNHGVRNSMNLREGFLDTKRESGLLPKSPAGRRKEVFPRVRKGRIKGAGEMLQWPVNV